MKYPVLQDSVYGLLAAYLLYEDLQPASWWRPFLDMIPRTFSTPFYWTAEEQKDLLDCCIADDLREERNSMEEDFLALQGTLFRDYPEAFPADKMTFSYFSWAYSAVMSRCMEVVETVHPITKTPEIECGIIPMAEILNHKYGSRSWDFHPESSSSVHFAGSPVAAGEQIFFDYGHEIDASFLCYYGFVPPFDLAHTAVPLRLRIPSSDPLAAEKIRRLALAGYTPDSNSLDFVAEVGADGPRLRTLRYMRVMFMTESEWSCSASKVVESGKDTWISLENERKVYREMARMLDEISRRYKTSLEDDLRRWENRKNLSPRQQMALQYRIQERRLLPLAILSVERTLNQLEQSS